MALSLVPWNLHSALLTVSIVFLSVLSTHQKKTIDEIFYLALRERRNNLLMLHSRWSNPLASTSRFESQIREATTLADKLSGGHPEISPMWLNATTVEALEEAPGEAGMQLSDVIYTPEEALEPEHAVWADYLTKDAGPSADDDDPPMITAELIWELPEVFFFNFFLRSRLTNCART